MHVNLFQFGGTRRDVRDALNRDQKRNHGTLQAFDAVATVCLIYLVRHQPPLDIAALVIGAFAAVSGLRYFVDQSIRNFYLHRLDWEDAGPDPD